MSEVVDKFPLRTYAKYDWRVWADGQIHKCTRGEDFHSTPKAFLKTASSWASYSNMSVRSCTRGDSVWLQFTLKIRRSVGRPVGPSLVRSAS